MKEFEEISAYIKEQLPSFDSYYPFAVKESETHKIIAKTADGLKYIFPDDRVGNFFFFIVEDVIKFRESKGLRLDNSSPDPLLATIPFSLVAVVEGADEFNLMDVLIRTLSNYGDTEIIVSSAIINKEAAVISLLRGMKKDKMNIVLARSKFEKVVIIKGEISKINYLANCSDLLICKDCN